MKLTAQKAGFAGYFRLIATKLDGSQRIAADWFPNLITDAGLNRLGTAGFSSHCQLGSGSVAPAVTDSTLTAYLTSTTNVFSQSTGGLSESPYYQYTRKTYRFAVGLAAGNIAEIGIGWASNGSLFSRSLVRDAEGDAVPITILADEILDVQYELRLYPPLGDAVGVVNIGGVDYTYTLRAASITSYWPSSTMGGFMTQGLSLLGASATVHNGPIGNVFNTPAGASGSSDYNNPTLGAYSNGSFYRDHTFSLTIDQGNLSGGVSAYSFYTYMGAYQGGFSPALPKDNTKTLSITTRLSWARKTL